MPVGSPAIACIGVIGKNDNPLHIAIFSHDAQQPPRDELELQFLLSSSLDIFEARLPQKSADHDFGLLQAIDERLAMYGWLTNTGVKFVVLVDMEGRPPGDAPHAQRGNTVFGIRDSDLKPAFRALHTAYIRLLRNPFYTPDGAALASLSPDLDAPPAQITSPKFIHEVDRIGNAWHPGIASI